MTTAAEGYEMCKSEWQLMDKIETVSVTDGTTTDTGVRAKRVGITRKEMQIAAKLGVSTGAEVFIVFVDTLTDLDLGEEDRIVADDGTYRVLTTKVQLWATQLRCVTQKQVAV